MAWLAGLARRLLPGGLEAHQRIPHELWADVLQRHPFLSWRSESDLLRLRNLSAQFLQHKEFHGAHGFVVTDAIALTVAAQACLPVLHLGLRAYDGFVGIVMHEGPVRAQRVSTDEFGLVHTWQEDLVGEALGDGPVMLSWLDGVDGASSSLGKAFNVVIHEFVHILDGLDGEFDGTPPMSARQRAHWQRTLQMAFDRFDERSACGYPSVMDDYGAQDPVEFFAVSSEAFFTQPLAFRAEQPEVHRLYVEFYQQDPTTHAPPTATPAA